MILDRVDERLRVFDAHPHGEGFGLEAHPAPVQQFVDVAGRMARGQDDGRPFDQFVAAPDTAYPSVVHLQVGHPALEAEHAAGIEDRLPDVLHDARQLVGSDMGMGLEEDFGVGTVEDQRLERLVVVAAFLAAGEELAIGEGAGTPFAEGVVRFGVDGSVAVDLGDVAFAGRDVASALEDDGPQPQLDQVQRREQTGGSRSDDDHLGAALDQRIIEMDRFGAGFAIDIDFERKVDLDLPLAGINRAFDDPYEGDFVLAQAHTAGSQGGICFRIGGLLGGKNKSYELRHCIKLRTKVTKKAG